MNTLVAEKIKRLRKSKGFSQEDMAEKLHISQSAYARIENGESNSWSIYLEKLSEIFEVKPENFVSDDSNNFNNQNHELNGGMAFQFVGTIQTINSLSDEQIRKDFQEIKNEVQQLKVLIQELKR